MVVINEDDFEKFGSTFLESKDFSDDVEVFANCDNRGMLQLNQEFVINSSDINKLYRMDKGAPFATGLYAQVKRCKSLQNSLFYAAKFCPRKRPGQSSDEECIENLHEIALLSQLKHPNIISYIDAFILDDCVVTILELAPGGDLQTVIDADLVLLEKDASRYIYQLLEALKYLHFRHIVHLDIKPQNLLLCGEFPTCDIKLCDFEISRVIHPGKEVKEIIGTPDYVAPEILLYEPLSEKADMWSVGILSYVLLTGFSPFGGDTDQETFKNIVHEPIDFPGELFEDISPLAIDLIRLLVVKNPKLRPTASEIENHQWIKSFLPEKVLVEVEPEQEEPIVSNSNSFITHTGPKKRSPRRTMAGCSTASASGRRPSARSILRACKSAYDLNKLGALTKSREALIERMKMASGDCSVGGNWKLRKNLSKSREQLWESKIQLSKSCEKINNNLPGSTRWASVANFPSLDLGAMKSSTSQESVISVVSTCTNIGGSTLTHQEILDWQQQSLLDDFSCPTPQPFSISMPNTPPIPNFDLSSPVNNINSGLNLCHDGSNVNYNNGTHHVHPPSEFNFPSLVNGTNASEIEAEEVSLSDEANVTAADLDESQKSVAELIATFGGRVGAATANGKKLDLKNQFEPILEVDGSEEQPISFGEYSNSNSGVSSILATTPPHREPKSVESGNFSSIHSSNSSDETHETMRANDRRSISKPKEDVIKLMKPLSRNDAPTIRRGTLSPSKFQENGNYAGLKGILKKPILHSPFAADPYTNLPSSTTSSRRGSIPGNCTRLYDTHTISSLAKVPKKSILKNSPTETNKSNRSSSIECPSNPNRRQSGERSLSKSPEIVKENAGESKLGETGVRLGHKGKVIPKGMSPRERPSFILLNDVSVKPKARKPTTTSNAPQKTSNANTPSVRQRKSVQKIVTNPTPRAPTKPRTSIREQIMRKKVEDKSLMQGNKSLLNVTVLLPRSRTNGGGYDCNKKSSPTSSPPTSPVEDIKKDVNKFLKSNSEGKDVEPAAVAFTIFPPDPVILPKLLKASLSQSQNLEENNNNGSLNCMNSNSSLNSLIHSNNSVNEQKSQELRPTGKNDILISKGTNKFDKMEKSTWGVVCTGSIGRAMERFETGTIKGKKLRRGSLPDF